MIGLAACEVGPVPGQPRLNGKMHVTIEPGSACAGFYGGTSAPEHATCSYALSPEYEPAFAASELRFTGRDSNRNVVLAELRGHPFFIGALFLPQAKALNGTLHPLLTAFLEAAERDNAARV